MFKYLGVLTVLVLSGSAFAQQKNDKGQFIVNVCGGGKTGTYIKFAQYLKLGLEPARGGGAFEVRAYETYGSMENLEALMDGRCDIAMVQSDAEMYFRTKTGITSLGLEVIAEPYLEAAHLVCHKDLNASTMADLEGKSQVAVYAGAENSGGYLTFNNLKNQYPKDYANISVIPVDGVYKDNKMIKDPATHSLELAATSKGCAFFVARVPSGSLESLVANESRLAADLRLVELTDRKFDNLKDSDGNKVYSFSSFVDLGGKSVYGKVRKPGWGSGAETTIVVGAQMIVNQEWYLNMLGELESRNRFGDVNRLNQVLERIKAWDGNTQALANLIKGVATQVVPMASETQQ